MKTINEFLVNKHIKFNKYQTIKIESFSDIKPGCYVHEVDDADPEREYICKVSEQQEKSSNKIYLDYYIGISAIDGIYVNIETSWIDDAAGNHFRNLTKDEEQLAEIYEKWLANNDDKYQECLANDQSTIGYIKGNKFIYSPE